MSNVFSVNVFHGSNVVVSDPEIRFSRYTKDFGTAFYVTKIEEQAHKWALQRSRRSGIPIVSIYEISPKCYSDAGYKYFKVMDEEWLDFIVDCRLGKSHNYSIVEGPMADDQVYNWVEAFTSGEITREAFWELVKFRHPTHQLAFCTEESLKYIKYKNFKVLEI